MTERPWATGSDEERWAAYFSDASRTVLRNKVGAVTAEELRDAENDLVEARVLELRARPDLVLRTYDLPHLRGLHRHLFQDVYEWAGELRTVGLSKGGGDAFMPPLQIEMPVAHVAMKITESDRLQQVDPTRLVEEVTYLYDYLNFAHPFREGNGRTQREFFDLLLAESNHGLDWLAVEMSDLHEACHIARTEDDTGPMHELFGRIITEDPAYPASG